MNEYIKQAAFCRISKGDIKRSDNTHSNPFLKTSCNLETYKLNKSINNKINKSLIYKKCIKFSRYFHNNTFICCRF